MCCANKKCALIKCIRLAIFFYVFHHFIFTEIYRFLPQFEDFNESGVVYSSYCAQHLLIDIGPKIAATFTVEIRKSKGRLYRHYPKLSADGIQGSLPIFSCASVQRSQRTPPRG